MWRDEPSHAARPELDGSTPVHVTMHAKLRGLRRYGVYKAFHRILKTYLGDKYFRIVARPKPERRSRAERKPTSPPTSRSAVT